MRQMEWDFATCALADYDADGHAQVTTDSPGEPNSKGVESAGTQPAESLLPLGFHARGLDPEKDPQGQVGLGASLLTCTQGSQRYALPLHDPRDVTKVPKLRKGGRMVEGGAGDYRSFFLITGLDPAGVEVPGSMLLSAQYKIDGAKGQLGVSFNIRKPGEEEIVILHGEGQKIVMSAKGSKPITIMNSKGSCWFETDDDGNTIAGDLTVQGGCTLGDPTATGVATQLSFVAFFAAFSAFITALDAFAAAAAAGTGPYPAGTLVATAGEALKAALMAPTNFSSKVKASV